MRFYILSLIIMLIVSGCVFSKSDEWKTIDVHLFQDEDCFKGCWRGLKIGETTEQGLLQFAEKNKIILGDKINLNSEDNFYYSANYETSNHFVDFLVKNELLMEIHLRGGFNTNLETVIQNIGSPDTAIYNYQVEEDGKLYIFSMLIYVNEGYIFSYNPSNFSYYRASTTLDICVQKSDKLQGIRISSFTSLEQAITQLAQDLFNEDEIASLEKSKERLGIFKDWSGFSCFELP